MKQSIKTIFTIICLSFTLNGCIFVVGAAAGAAAIAVVYDHRTIKNAFKDTKIANIIASKIRLVPELRNESHVEVTVFNRVVLLTGETPNANFRQEAAELPGQPMM